MIGESSDEFIQPSEKSINKGGAKTSPCHANAAAKSPMSFPALIGPVFSDVAPSNALETLRKPLADGDGGEGLW